MKTWLRWTHGIRLWVPPAIYELQQTEGWLLGDNSTPRAIVTDPERCDFLLNRYSRIDRELDFSDASSPQNTVFTTHHHEEDLVKDQALELPFPELENLGNQHRVDIRPYQLSAHGLKHAVKERILFMPLKEPKPTWDVSDKPFPEPPNKTMHGLMVSAPTPASPTRLAGVHPPLPSTLVAPLPSSPSFRSPDRRAFKKREVGSFSGSVMSDDDVDFADDEVDNKGRGSLSAERAMSITNSWEHPDLHGNISQMLSMNTMGGSMARQPLDVREAVDHDMDAYSRLRCRFQSSASDKAGPVKPVVLRPKN